MHGTNVIVGGGAISARNSMEIWSHEKGTNGWSRFPVSIGANDAKLLSSGKNLYLLGGWEPYDNYEGGLYKGFESNIWKIDNKFKFDKVGNMTDRKTLFTAFNIRRGYLTKCQGVLMLKS